MLCTAVRTPAQAACPHTLRAQHDTNACWPRCPLTPSPVSKVTQSSIAPIQPRCGGWATAGKGRCVTGTLQMHTLNGWVGGWVGGWWAQRSGRTQNKAARPLDTLSYRQSTTPQARWRAHHFGHCGDCPEQREQHYAYHPLGVVFWTEPMALLAFGATQPLPPPCPARRRPRRSYAARPAPARSAPTPLASKPPSRPPPAPPWRCPPRGCAPAAGGARKAGPPCTRHCLRRAQGAALQRLNALQRTSECGEGVRQDALAARKVAAGDCPP